MYQDPSSIIFYFCLFLCFVTRYELWFEIFEWVITIQPCNTFTDLGFFCKIYPLQHTAKKPIVHKTTKTDFEFYETQSKC